jgi:glutamate carboxypeptidase
VATYRLVTRGKAAHAGIEPERGISAITEIAGQILAAQALADTAKGTTVTVGVMQGGTASNVVPAEATASVDVRFTQAGEGERIHQGLLALRPTLTGAAVEVLPLDTRPPLERSARVIALYQQARAIAGELGQDLGEGSTGGGSDGCLTAALGIATLDGLGPQGGGAHAIDEHVLRHDLSFRLAFFGALLERL